MNSYLLRSIFLFHQLLWRHNSETTTKESLLYVTYIASILTVANLQENLTLMIKTPFISLSVSQYDKKNFEHISSTLIYLINLKNHFYKCFHILNSKTMQKLSFLVELMYYL